MADVSHTSGSEITLRDVIAHMQGMELRLLKEIAGLDKKFTVRIDKLELHVSSMERVVLQRLDVLEEDLTTVVKDTLHIRRHVGMAAGEEG